MLNTDTHTNSVGRCLWARQLSEVGRRSTDGSHHTLPKSQSSYQIWMLNISKVVRAETYCRCTHTHPHTQSRRNRTELWILLNSWGITDMLVRKKLTDADFCSDFTRQSTYIRRQYTSQTFIISNIQWQVLVLNFSKEPIYLSFKKENYF